MELVKHRPLQGRCFTELAPETGARLNHLTTRSSVRSVWDRICGRGLDPMAEKVGPGRFELPTSRLSGVSQMA